MVSKMLCSLTITTINTSGRLGGVCVARLISYSIKTHGSESRGQEEAGLRDERVSYLQVAPP